MGVPPQFLQRVPLPGTIDASSLGRRGSEPTGQFRDLVRNPPPSIIPDSFPLAGNQRPCASLPPVDYDEPYQAVNGLIDRLDAFHDGIRRIFRQNDETARHVLVVRSVNIVTQ